MITFIANLWSIGTKLPAIVAIIKAIIDVIGSDQIKSILQTIKDVVTKETEKEEIPATEPQRLRLVDRIKTRLGLAWLGVTQDEYTEYCKAKGVSGMLNIVDHDDDYMA
jgi:hypothetical protein